MSSSKRWLRFSLLTVCVLGVAPVSAQDILGAITGTVKDSSGAAIADATVKARSVSTNQEITQHTDGNGSYSALNLPIGMYEVTISKTGFQTESHTQVLVSGDRTSTVDAALQVATASSTVNVVASTPLMNQTDTTNGYVVDQLTMENTPLGTGSFTQLAIMAPGVHADFLSSSGSNGGLGNQAIYSNGQRATSNSFSMNGVDTNNLFNGNSTSGVTQYRFVLNEGENFPAGGGIQTATSVYAAIGQALPSPPVETMQEVSVNAAQYDATQGAHSGAHIGIITKSGTNGIHGELYEYFQNSDMEAAPFFNNASPAYSNSQKVPFQVRNMFGATLGGPIKKDKLFYFLSYQGVRNADAQDSTQTTGVPLGLTNDRSVTGLLNMYNATTGKTLAASQINPVSLAVMSATLPNGQFLIPTPQITNAALAKSLGYDVKVQGPDALSSVDQGIANIDYLLSSNDRLTAKYYVQHDPTSTPFSPNSYFLGFPQTLTAGSQVASVENTQSITPSMTMVERVGFTRMLAYASTQAELTAQQMGINLLGVTAFPLIEINDFDTTLGSEADVKFGNSTSFGNAGMYQNNWELGDSLTWVKGRHTLSFGYKFDHTQLNIINDAAASSIIGFSSLANFLEGSVRKGSYSDLFPGTGSADRYYRSNTTGLYVNDNWKVRSNLTVTLGLRWDNDGALSEKYGRLVGFNGSQYAYNAGTDTITNDGLEFAGQNGASSTLMQNPQWGFAPRVGVAWSPRSNLTVRTGYGIYYDRGEYFTEFSPSAGGGFNGPFAVTLEPPFNSAIFATTGTTFANPFGTTAPAAPVTTPAAFQALLPNLADTTAGSYPAGNAFGPFLFGGYDITNKLPYTQNWTFDLQYQASNSWLFTAGYVGNHGTHLVLPIPFNQPGIATATNPINGQTASYGGISPLDLTNEPIDPAPSYAGNAELRVPYLGYDMNSVLYKAEGISNFDALELQVRKQLSFGLTFTASYTWSHSLDEQSGEGIFFTGNNPLDLNSSYGTSDFDQTHVFLVNYNYTIPAKFGNKSLDQVLGGWTISGQAVAQSGMPYSVYDYSGSVASLYYGGDVYIANPILPLKAGVTPQKAELQPGTLGVNAGSPVLNVADFYPQFVQPGTNGVPACNASGCDSYESLFSGTGRNIFRGPFQTRFDMGLGKQFVIHDKYRLRFNATAFNVFNHPDFDAPNNDVTYFADFTAPPLAVPEGSLGYIQHTIGSSRFLQLALHLSF